jgi:hypothetical protein
VSLLNVVATIERPASHQGTDRPEAKNSEVLFRRACRRTATGRSRRAATRDDQPVDELEFHELFEFGSGGACGLFFPDQRQTDLGLTAGRDVGGGGFEDFQIKACGLGVGCGGLGRIEFGALEMTIGQLPLREDRFAVSRGTSR